MQININKILGYLLIFVGAAIIFWTFFHSYNIFTVKTTPPEIFKTPAAKIISPKTKTGNLEFELESVMKEQLGEQLKEVIPSDVLPKLLNLISWSIGAGVLIFSGSAISTVGIKLIK